MRRRRRYAFVMPAKAGIQAEPDATLSTDPSFRLGDGLAAVSLGENSLARR
jgi:hypothetical protein